MYYIGVICLVLYYIGNLFGVVDVKAEGTMNSSTGDMNGLVHGDVNDTSVNVDGLAGGDREVSCVPGNCTIPIGYPTTVIGVSSIGMFCLVYHVCV